MGTDLVGVYLRFPLPDVCRERQSRLFFPGCHSKLQERVSRRKKDFYSLRLDSLPVTTKNIARHTARDKIFSRRLSHAQKSWPVFVDDERIQPYVCRRRELNVHKGVSRTACTSRFLLRLQAQVLDGLHKEHPGVILSKELDRSYVWWSSLNHDLEQKGERMPSLPTPAVFFLPSPLCIPGHGYLNLGSVCIWTSRVPFVIPSF